MPIIDLRDEEEKNPKYPCPKCGSKAISLQKKYITENYEDDKKRGTIKRIPRKYLAKMKEFSCANCGHEFNRPKPKKNP